MDHTLFRRFLGSAIVVVMLSLVIAGLQFYGVINMALGRFCFESVWIIGVGGIIFSEWVWKKKFGLKLVIGVAASAVLGIGIYCLDAWAKTHGSLASPSAPPVAQNTAQANPSQTPAAAPADSKWPKHTSKHSTLVTSTPAQNPIPSAPPLVRSNSGGSNNSQIRTVSQGPGSAFSVGQTGGVTAGTYIGPVEPKVGYRKKESNGSIQLEIWVDKPYPSAKFAVVCDRPCKAVDAKIDWGGSDPGTRIFPEAGYGIVGKPGEYPDIAAFVVYHPETFGTDITLKGTVKSDDNLPFNIIKVERLTITPPR
jgi:hypothetical protein